MFQFRETNNSLFDGKGHFSIGFYSPKYPVNVGCLWRTAAILKASFIYIIDGEFIQQKSDTTKAHLHIPVLLFKNFKTFKESLYPNINIVAVEMTDKAIMVDEFHHPERASYLLGNETTGIPEHVLEQCKYHIKCPGDVSLNVAIAGSIVLYERWRQHKSIKPIKLP